MDPLSIFWLICVFTATALGHYTKNQGGSGFLLGMMLGPLGILITLLLPHGGRTKCAFCRERIDKAAAVCPRCQRDQPGK